MVLTYSIAMFTLVFSLYAWQDNVFLRRYIGYPYGEFHQRQYYRWCTAMFVHLNGTHLFFNVYTLLSFGPSVEYLLHGYHACSLIYLLIYLGGGVFAAYVDYRRCYAKPLYFSCGASAAICSLMTCYTLFNPLKRVYLFGIISLPVFLFELLVISIAYYNARYGSGRINHWSHLVGIMYGVVVTLLCCPPLLLTYKELLMRMWSSL